MPEADSRRTPRFRSHSANVTITKESIKIVAPSAKVAGSLDGNRKELQIYTGSVGSVLERKKASTNSSKEMVKVSNKLATMPGRMTGNVTRQNVIQAFSPRSKPASSMLLSNPSIRETRTSIEKGTQRSRCAKPTVKRESDMLAKLNKIKRDIPRIISGITKGIMMKPTRGALPGIR